MATLFLFVSLSDSSADAKRRRSRSSTPPLKIVEVTTSPTPFPVGTSLLEFSIVVELPKDPRGSNVLEISSLIASPTSRSIRFLSQRVPIVSQINRRQKPRVPATMIWDGRDQTGELVESGSYHYEVRAKLMVDEGDGPRTKMVSLRARGMIEVSNFEFDKTGNRTE